ncbi:MAG: hypothetical protein AB7P76_05225 [Candidatus Melainabacteria bacterium]
MLNKLLELIAGKPLALGITLLGLVQKAIAKNDVKNLAQFVYDKLPKHWKEPAGPATEREFVDLIEAAQKFVERLIAVSSK